MIMWCKCMATKQHLNSHSSQRLMDYLGGHSTVLEAEELIQRWLAGVESASGGRGDEPLQITAVSGESLTDNKDFLSSVDWISGDVGQNTKDVLQGLLNKELKSETSYTTSKKRLNDPLVTMEMRHREVRRRRELREKKKRDEEERRKLTEQAQREAKVLVMEEERKAKARAAEEEKLIEQQMKALRKEVRERERLCRQVALEQSLAVEETKELSGDGDVVVEAQKFIKSERQRVATRMELMRQLEEAEVNETKENVKLLHQCFQSWWSQAMEGRGKLAKAMAVRDWKLVLSVWKAWMKFVQERKERKTRDQLARWLQREKRMMEVACQHHTSRMLQQSLRAWQRITRQEKAKRKQAEEQQLHKTKMAALLQAATAKAEKQRIVEDPVALDKHSPEHINPLPPPPQGSDSPATPNSHIHHKIESPRKIHSSCERAGPVWKEARKQLDDLLSQVDTPLTAPVKVAGADPVKTNKSRPHRLKPKPATKQLTMTAAMERRSAEIAERRLAREQRREAKSRERAEQIALEEEEQRKAEAALRETRLKEKREERRLAKQRELERIERQKVLTEKNAKAFSHYQIAQLKWRGMEPWKKFIEELRIQYCEADQQREKVLVRQVWLRWHKATLQKEKERNTIASNHYEQSLLRRSLTAWIKLRELGCELEALAEHYRPKFLLQRIFRGWCRIVREERVVDWEKIARARRFRERQVQCSVMRAWHGFVPLAKEEREREKRRDELRRKVASWLNDYKPSSHAIE